MAESLFNKRYRIEQELGRGAMGTIYRATDTLLDRLVALKVITSSQLTDENRDRLLSEAKAAAKLNHPNIVAVYDAGEQDHTPFIVMELVEGGSLYDRKPDSLEEIISISRQICSALEHAHQHGIVHRDLKPENVLRAAKGVIKLNDFGMAHSFSSRISNEGTLLGTVYYIAPETIQGKIIDGRADLYALGVMLYEWMTGNLPFTAEDPVAVISQHLYAPIVPPHIYTPQITPEMEDLILRLLSKEPGDRPESASVVEAALRRISSGVAGDFSSPTSYRLDRIVRGKLVGREKELEQGRAVWQQVLTGSGHVLLVSGEPGIGKTRFVRELIANATVTGGRCLVGECFSEGGAPFDPLAPMIRESIGEGVKKKPDLPEYVLTDLIRITPGLEGIQHDNPPRLSLDASSEQQHIFESVVFWANALAEKNPLLLFFDDIHWGDSATLLLIRHLAHRLQNQRVLIVLSYREIELRDEDLANTILHELQRDHLASRLKLTRFSARETGEMIATILTPSGRIDPELIAAIHQETEGNPFFIEEVCKTLLEEGQLCCEQGEWVSPGIEDIAIPQSVRLTVQSRLARLPEDSQDVLRLAAVIGREFEFNILRKACEKDEDRIIEALESAEKAQIIRELKKSSSEPVTFAFEHALIPATLREEISGLRRQKYHRRAAEAIQEIHPEDYESLSYHFEECGDADKALENYFKAGNRALEMFANEEALNYFGKVLELSQTNQSLAEANAGVAEAAFRLGQREKAEKAFDKAIDMYRAEGDFDRMARLYSAAARAVWYMGEVKWGLEICRQGLAEMPEGFETKGMAILLHETARACRFNYLYDEALELVRKALVLAEKLNLPEVIADSYATLGIIRILPYEEGTAALEKAIAISVKNGYTAILARARLNLGTHLIYGGNPLGAHDQYSRILELTSRTGLNYIEFLAQVSLLDLEVSLSRYADAETRMERLIELQPINPNPAWAMANIQGYKVIFLWIKGLRDEALELIDQVLPELKDDSLKDFRRYLLFCKSRFLGELGRLEEIKKTLTEILTFDLEDLDENPGYINYSLHQIYFYLKDKAAANEQYEILKKTIGPAPTVTQTALVETAEARCAWLAKDYDRALAAYKFLISKITPLMDLWRIAFCHEEIASMLLERNEPGDLDKAKSHLEKALDLYQSAKIESYARLVKGRLQNLSENST
jgi:predicted ATPase/predicted Ser/Thr protein kinase